MRPNSANNFIKTVKKNKETSSDIWERNDNKFNEEADNFYSFMVDSEQTIIPRAATTCLRPSERFLENNVANNNNDHCNNNCFGIHGGD